MSKSTRDANLAQDDDYLDDSNDWSDRGTDDFPQERVKPNAHGRPKWKAIEDYWEQKRLKDALEDYLTEEE